MTEVADRESVKFLTLWAMTRASYRKQVVQFGVELRGSDICLPGGAKSIHAKWKCFTHHLNW